MILIILTLSNCSNNDNQDDNEGQIEVENEEQSILEWTEVASIPNDALRLAADVVTYNNEAYLLPGKGGTRFSSKPEILKFSDNTWTQVATYDGFATAGNSGAWRNDDEIFILGGVNGSNAPTDEVRSFSISNNSFNEEPLTASVSVNTAFTSSKGYIGTDEGFLSYDFDTEIWEPIIIAELSQSIATARMTVENDIIYALYTNLDTNNFFAFVEATNEWIVLPDFPGTTRTGAIIVSTETDIYTGLGVGEQDLLDIWRFNIETNEWVNFTEYPGTHFNAGFAFELDNDLFIGGGVTESPISNEALNNEVYRLNL